MKPCAKMILLSLVLVTLAAAAHAEPTHPNEIGLYTTEDGYGATGTFVTGTPVSLYLVLTKPSQMPGEVPYTDYFGFELRMEFDPLPAGDLTLLEINLPGNNVDVGNKDFPAGWLEFVCGIDYNNPLPVVDEAVTVAELVFLNSGATPIRVYLKPNADFQSVAGEMGFLGGFGPGTDYDLLAMYPVSGSHDAPVFEFNGSAVPVEDATFGTVKALYR